MQKSEIFFENAPSSPAKLVAYKPSALLAHNDPSRGPALSEKPNMKRINSSEAMKSLHHAKKQAQVYSARRNNSSVTFA